ncbi:DUF1648 domain-containing protein [Cryobacterium algoricola]|uniref:DUF1648 domain-containing protein n=1 Tax=Cryobacterium algoricola TaxID=1259183 RepID=A0ABY2IFZ3_9MICO|nr:DUF1648 domain-containing protein [Cryobacterium algoricola]TFB87270.1 DUF1648 domain-containing protein [Cryobacterium algoricola]
MTGKQRVPSGFIIAAILTWIPAAALLTAHALQIPPDLIPVHWDGTGSADGFDSPTNVFWLSLVPSVICGVIAICVALAGSGLRRIQGALAFAAIATVAAAVSLQWAVDVRTAIDAQTIETNRIGAPFLLYLLAIGWGLVVYAAGTIGKHFPETEGKNSDESLSEKTQ